MRKHAAVGLLVMALALIAIKVAAHASSVCAVSGSGTSEGGVFGGSAASQTDLGSHGTWTFSTAGGDHFAGTISSLTCSKGSSGDTRSAELGGPLTWNGRKGYSFAASAIDAETDVFQISIRDANGNRVYGERGRVRLGEIAVDVDL
jgi:hypothetical protein